MKPVLIKGSVFNDERGKLYFNNSFSVSLIKKMYFIDNDVIKFKRGWQGHKIGQRCFSAVLGSFQTSLIAIDNWDNPSPNLISEKFILN